MIVSNIRQKFDMVKKFMKIRESIVYKPGLVLVLFGHPDTRGVTDGAMKATFETV